MADSGEVIIVGAGIAGLSCACYLSKKGIPFRILEASDSVGGRVRTDEVDGFLLDRGFQVFLTAYPEAKKLLDYDKLNLATFEPGALIRYDGKFHRFSDPWRKPSSLLATAMAPVATLGDKLRVAKFRSHTSTGSITDIYDRKNIPTIELLANRGFSNVILDRFFKPFLGGVFLDPTLQTSSRMCEFVFRMFSKGNAVIPSDGMQEIPNQLASKLPDDSVVTNCPIKSIDRNTVTLGSGEQIEASGIVIATSEPVANQLFGITKSVNLRRATTIYFASSKVPDESKTLVLNGEGKGPVNNLSVQSQIAPNYAPTGQSLISVTVLEGYQDKDLMMKEVRQQMKDWFGSQVDAWQHLKTYEIEYALPSMLPNEKEPIEKPTNISDGVFICGDHCDTASINGAMASGRRAAESVATYLE